MKRLALEDIITGVLLLLVLGIASCFSAPAVATPLTWKWETPEGIHEESFDLSDPESRAAFRKDFANNHKVSVCAARADYAVELMDERDNGTSEKYHLDIMEVNYERTKNEPKGAVAWHVYVDFQRMVRDLHRASGSEFFFTDPDNYWEREFRWCFLQ